MLKNKDTLKLVLVIILSISVFAGISGGLFSPNPDTATISDDSATNANSILDEMIADIPCLKPNVPLARHVHPRLNIIINNIVAPIPPNIGISMTCERPLHTHEEDPSIIHVESQDDRNYTLGDFFRIWGKNFDNNQIFDSRIDENHELIFSVNDQRSQEFNNLILEDRQVIKIEYRAK